MTNSTSLPTHLHHYTSIRGVEGIVTTKAIWASLLHFMNDSGEWLYALDLVKQSLRKKVGFRNDDHWLVFVADLTTSLSRIGSLNICVFSLTLMPNQLSQWRAYCPSEGGYNISFQTAALKEHLDRHKFQLMQCVYDPNEQRSEIDKIVENVLKNVGTLENEDAMEKAREAALNQFTTQLSIVAPIFKHPDFSEEQEWRAFALVFSDDPRMEYHVRGSVAVPHCVLKIETATSPFPISQITVGPNAHQNLAARGLNALAHKAGLRINTLLSSTPLRNL